MVTCRCGMCGRKSSNTNHARNHFLQAGIRYSDSAEENKGNKVRGNRRLRRVLKNNLRNIDREEN